MRPVIYALLAAFCYGISIPFSKVLQNDLPPAFIAALLYLGAGFGIVLIKPLFHDQQTEAKLNRSDLPYVVSMIILDIAAPLFLMAGLTRTSAATVSLLGNFEIVATSLVAWIVFREAIGKHLWLALVLISFSSALLSVEDLDQASISSGAILVLIATVCWGFENNITNKLSLRNPLQVVIIKGFGSGIGAMLIAWLGRSIVFKPLPILAALVLGFVAYGLSLTFYILAQRVIGAARTSAYYAFAPFFGVLLSFLIFRERPNPVFFAAFTGMALGAALAAAERHDHLHAHEEIAHEHRHRHDDMHHDHVHFPPVGGEHSHFHVHLRMAHSHAHKPDAHHRHQHGLDL